MFVCILPAACWLGPAKSQGSGRGTVRPLSQSLPCGEEGVKRYELLPGDVIAAEKEALQAGQEVHLSLERERERGRGRRERWRDVKRRRCSGRGHCIVTVVRALNPSPFPQSPCSSQLQYTASPSTLRMHTHTHIHIQHRALSAHGEEGQEKEREREHEEEGGRGERAVCAALMQRSPAAGS